MIPKSITTLKPAPIKPSTIVYVDDVGNIIDQGDPVTLLKAMNRFFWQVIRALLLSVVLALLSALISIYSYRILYLDVVTITTVLDTILKDPLPAILTLIGATVSSLAFTCVWYSKPSLKHYEGTPKPSKFTYFVSALIVIYTANFFLFRLSSLSPFTVFGLDFVPSTSIQLWAPPRDFITLVFPLLNLLQIDANLYPYATRILLIQIISLLITFLLILPHRYFAPVTRPPRMYYLLFVTPALGLLRLLVISLFLILLVVCFIVYQHEPSLDSFINMQELLTHFDNTVGTIAITAFAVSIVIAALFHWPPKFRQIKQSYWLIRILLIILGAIWLGYNYRILDNPEAYLDTIMMSTWATLLTIPIQRSLS